MLLKFQLSNSRAILLIFPPTMVSFNSFTIFAIVIPSNAILFIHSIPLQKATSLIISERRKQRKKEKKDLTVLSDCFIITMYVYAMCKYKTTEKS